MKVLDKIVMSEYAPNNPNVLWVKEGILHKMENGKWIPIGDGNDGKEGKPGYTPQRGIDYWTQSDKQEVIEEATAEIVNPIVYKGTLGVGGTQVTGTLESFVARQRESGKVENLVGINLGYSGVGNRIKFNGHNLSVGATKMLTWTATTITFDGETITA